MESTTNVNASWNTSRRGFLKGLTVSAAGAAAAGMATGAAVESATADPAAAEKVYPYTVHTTDVLIVGGGMTGKAAARVAMANGASVTIIEKGKWGHSGNSTSGRAVCSPERSDDPTGVKAASAYIIDLLGIADQEYVVANMKADIENPALVAVEAMGNPIGRTTADGVMFPEGSEDAAFVSGFVTWTQISAQDVVRRGVEIHDRTMMVDIVTDEDGRTSGVIAIDLTTGQAQLYRAKSVILATSSFQWAQGQTVAGPDTTGEGCAILMKRGLAMRDLELNCVDLEGGCIFDQMLDGPDQGWFEPANAIVNPAAGLCRNKYGEDFMAGFFADPNITYAESFVGGVLCMARELMQGNGEDLDTIYVDLADVYNDPMGGWMTQYVPAWEEMNDGTVDFSHIKVYGESFGSAAAPKVNYETFETEIPGLYSAMPSIGSFPTAFCWGTGIITGTAAAKAAVEMPLPSYSDEDVQAILAKNYSWLEKDFTEDSLRPVEIMRKIQGQFAKNLLWYKNEEGINGAIAELMRIRDEDLPRMATASKTMVMNREWRNAMEVESMLVMSLAAAYASLERRESRPMHFRTDYPKIDNENFLAHIWVSMNEDGSFNVEKTDVEGTYISREDLIAALPDIDISQPNPPMPSGEGATFRENDLSAITVSAM